MPSFNVAVVAESPVSWTLRKTYALTNNVAVTKTRSTKAQRPRETRETLLRQTQRSMMFRTQIILPLKAFGGLDVLFQRWCIILIFQFRYAFIPQVLRN